MAAILVNAFKLTGTKDELFKDVPTTYWASESIRLLQVNKIITIYPNKYEPIKPGDVLATYASTDLLQNAVGFKLETSIQEGLQKFADWYVDYYKVKYPFFINKPELFIEFL